jgi:hypothetical protein
MLARTWNIVPQEDNMPTDLFSGMFFLVAFLALCIGTFLAFRQVALWYFRLNQIADNLAVIADYYRTQEQATTTPTVAQSSRRVP